VHEIVVPTYPRLARVAQLEGSPSVELEIGKDGKVLSAKGSGAHPLLVQDAEKCLRQWVFAPIPEGLKLPVKHKVTFRYKLQGKPQYYDPVPRVVLHLPDLVEITSRPYEIQP
jgi:TonB family protein